MSKTLQHFFQEVCSIYYRFTVAKASNLDDPQVIFITVNAQ